MINELNVDKNCIMALLQAMQVDCFQKILICHTDVDIFYALQDLYSDKTLSYLQETEVENFICEINPPVEKQYDVIVDFGLIAATKWDKALIRAMGFHLHQNGELCVLFPQTSGMSHYRVTNILHGTCWMIAGIYGAAANGTIRGLSGWGYNVDDIVLYGIGMCSFDRETAWLQNFCTDEERRELSNLLRRIEYDVASEGDVESLRVLCRDMQVSDAYLRRFVLSATDGKERVLDKLVALGILTGEKKL